MSPWALLAVYCLLIVLASLGGGLIPHVVRLTHRGMELIVSFVAGVMLGVGLLHLLPHAFHALVSIDRVVLWTLIGILVMFFTQRFFRFHVHDVPPAPPADPTADPRHAAADEHRHAAHVHHPPHPQPAAGHAHATGLGVDLAWGGAAVGLTLHSLVEGIALASSVEAEYDPQLSALAGLGVFLVIFLHKPFDAMTIGTLMARGHRPARIRHIVNALFALMVTGGVAIYYLGATASGPAVEQYVGCALAFSAGTFLCISMSDLLPELQFHRHDRVKLSAALLAGLSVAYAVGLFEHAGHDAPDPADARPHTPHSARDHEA